MALPGQYSFRYKDKYLFITDSVSYPDPSIDLSLLDSDTNSWEIDKNVELFYTNSDVICITFENRKYNEYTIFYSRIFRLFEVNFTTLLKG